MLKLIGAMLVLLAGAMFGFYQALLLARRPKQIRQLISALQRLETEVVYGFTPLPDAFASIANSLAQPLAGLFRTASNGMRDSGGGTAEEAWRDAVERHWPSVAMKAGEKEALLRFGATLGISDREDQIKHLRLTASQLKTEEETAAEEQRRYENMWRSLGVLAGALIVILMY